MIALWQDIFSTVKWWLWKCAFQLVAKKTSSMPAFSGKLNAIAGMNRCKDLSGHGLIDVTKDVLEMLIKYVEEQMRCLFIRRWQIWMGSAYTISHRHIKFSKIIRSQVTVIWQSKNAEIYVKDGIYHKDINISSSINMKNFLFKLTLQIIF